MSAHRSRHQGYGTGYDTGRPPQDGSRGRYSWHWSWLVQWIFGAKIGAPMEPQLLTLFMGKIDRPPGGFNNSKLPWKKRQGMYALIPAFIAKQQTRMNNYLYFCRCKLNMIFSSAKVYLYNISRLWQKRNISRMQESITFAHQPWLGFASHYRDSYYANGAWQIKMAARKFWDKKNIWSPHFKKCVPVRVIDMKKPKRVDGSSCFGQCWVAVGLALSISRGYDSPTIGWSKPVICETKNQDYESDVQYTQNGTVTNPWLITNLFEEPPKFFSRWVSSRGHVQAPHRTSSGSEGP